MAKRSVDMSRLSRVSKTDASAAVPFASARSVQTMSAAKPMGLTVVLEAEDYAALRNYCLRRELGTGKRLTHREVMVSALRAYLASEPA